MRKKEAAALAAAERGKLFADGPRAQHPHIDVSHCIGCGACVDVCPEGDVLAVIARQGGDRQWPTSASGTVSAPRACPVGAIEIVMASPSVSADMPRLSRELRDQRPRPVRRRGAGRPGLDQERGEPGPGLRRHDRGAPGPRGPRSAQACSMSASWARARRASAPRCARWNGSLSYVTLEQDELGGTVAKYPRQKLVMTSPVEFPHARQVQEARDLEGGAAGVLDASPSRRRDCKVRTGEKVETHQAGGRRHSSRSQHRAGPLPGAHRDPRARPPRHPAQARRSRARSSPRSCTA